jgi:hypothetical protein
MKKKLVESRKEKLVSVVLMLHFSSIMLLSAPFGAHSQHQAAQYH